MACIDIYEPGRLLTVPFLMEQIWLRAEGKEYSTTEVYDFLLQVDDDKALDSFRVGYPHFCRTQRDGSWVDSVTLSRVGDSATGWGWHYYGPGQYNKDKGELIMHVATDDPSSVPCKQLRGLAQLDNQICWHPYLNRPDRIKHMQDMRKSLYQVTLKRPLQPGKTMWFRLIVQPSILDAPPPDMEVPNALLDLLFPSRRNVVTKISSPFHVRRSFCDKLAEHASLVGDLEQFLVTEGFEKQGTSTRIEDHRLRIANYPRIGIIQQGDSTRSLTYHGAGPARLKLPMRKHSLVPDDAKLEDVDTVLLSWSTGSTQKTNAERDLVTAANSIRSTVRRLAGSKASIKASDLVQFAIPYASAMHVHVLLEKLIRVGLLKQGDEGVISAPTLAHKELRKAFCDLRRIYLDPIEFTDDPDARLAFTDMHPFRVDFSCQWNPSARWRAAVLILIALFSFVAMVFSLLSYFRIDD